MAGGVTDNIIINVNSNASNAANGLDRLRNALGRVSSHSGRTNSALKRIVSVLKQTGSAASALSRILGNSMVGNMKRAASSVESLLRSLKRVAMMRAMRALIREITQGFAEGIKNLYQWSQLAGTTFYRSMNMLATASQYLKNSLAAMASPLIEAVAPAIDYIVDKFVDMFNIVNQIIAKLTGRTSYTAAKKVAAQWGDASKKASGSAKSAADDIKRTILGFDEINKLNDQNKSSGSGGSGSGSGSTNYADMFETRQINSWISDIVETGNWSLLGSAVADMINKALGSIDWEVIKNKAKNVAKSFASLINGFIEEIDPVVIGKTLLGVITSAFTYIGTFWGSIEFAAAGLKLKQAIMTFFDGIDVEELAHNMTAKFRGIVTFIADAIPSTREEWDVISRKISGFIEAVVKVEIPWATIGETIGSLLIGGMTAITSLAENMTLTEIATGVKTVIENSLKGITREDIEKLIGSVLHDVLTAVDVLLSIEIKIDGLPTIDPQTIIVFALAAKALLGNVIGGIFGGGAYGANGLLMASFGLGIMAVIKGLELDKKVLLDGEPFTVEDVAGVLEPTLEAAGLFMLSRGNYKAGLTLLGIDIALRLTVKDIDELKSDIEHNGITANSIFSILALVFKGTGAIVGMRGLAGLVGAMKGGAGGAAGAAAGAAGGGAALGSALWPIGIGVSLILFANGLTNLLTKLKMGEKLGVNDVADVVSSAFTAAGLGLMKVSPETGFVVLSIGVLIKLVSMGADWDENPGQALKETGNVLEGVQNAVADLIDPASGKMPDDMKSALRKYSLGGILVGGIQMAGEALEERKNSANSNATKGRQRKISGIATEGSLRSSSTLMNSGVGSQIGNGAYSSMIWSYWNNQNFAPGNGGKKFSYGNPPEWAKKILGDDGVDVPVTFTKKDTSLVDNPQKNGIKTGVTFTTGGLFSGGIYSAFNSTFLKWFGGGNKSKGQADLDTKVALKKNGWTSLSNFVGSAIDAGVRLYKGNYSSLQSFVGSWVEVELYLVPGDYATGAVMGSLIGVGYRAKGGVFSGGRWSDIPQYANGTPDAGTLFWAGEGGPEAIGHANGRTEVLNKSQLASAMYAAVTSAMKPASANFHDAAASMGSRNGSNDDLIEYVKDANAVLLRQNELLKQQNEYLRSINGKDFTAQITTQSINDAQRRSNRRAGVAVTTG